MCRACNRRCLGNVDSTVMKGGPVWADCQSHSMRKAVNGSYATNCLHHGAPLSWQSASLSWKCQWRAQSCAVQCPRGCAATLPPALMRPPCQFRSPPGALSPASMTGPGTLRRQKMTSSVRSGGVPLHLHIQIILCSSGPPIVKQGVSELADTERSSF